MRWAWLLEVGEVGLSKKGPNDRIMAGFAGPKTASSRGTIDAKIDLRI